jgi:uncharacterized protein (DUF488 family)
MEQWLPEAGVAYRWEADLGGFRKPETGSANTGLRHPAFRGYADYMATPRFQAAFARLLEDVKARPTAVMCSESVWWRCHRRLIADAATLQAHLTVAHLMHDGTRRPHQLTDGATLRDGHVVYPGDGLFDLPT